MESQTTGKHDCTTSETDYVDETERDRSFEISSKDRYDFIKGDIPDVLISDDHSNQPELAVDNSHSDTDHTHSNQVNQYYIY